MSPTFNIELWKKLQLDFLDGKVFFGIAPESSTAPYCVLHVLDYGDDYDTRTLCGEMTSESEIQFNIYDFNDIGIDEKVNELCNILQGYTSLDNYVIDRSARRTARLASGFSAEVGSGSVDFTFSYQSV